MYFGQGNNKDWRGFLTQDFETDTEQILKHFNEWFFKIQGKT